MQHWLTIRAPAGARVAGAAVACCLTLLASAPGRAQTPDGKARPKSPLTDATASESATGWRQQGVTDLAASTDAKVGGQSLTAMFGTTHNISLPAGERSWNLTCWEKLRFWAKSDPPTTNLLVMLCTKGWSDRRDAAVSLTNEWTLHELAFDDAKPWKKTQGDFTLTRVERLVFYNNGKPETKIWIDGLEFVGSRPGKSVEAKALQLPEDETVKVLRVATEDPFPHLAEAERGRHEARPRYALPPVAFNQDNAFKDALVDFDEAQYWKAIVRQADGCMCLSSDQPLRGTPNLKIELVPTGEKPWLTLLPPEPVPVERAFNVVECWAYGYKSGAGLAFHFRRQDGSLLVVGENCAEVAAGVTPARVHQGWALARTVLPEKVKRGAALLAVHVWPKPAGHPTLLVHLDQMRVLDFDECMRQPPPRFENAGAVVDNFPVDPEGACPRTVEPVATSVAKVGDAYHLVYVTDSGDEVRYVYTPATGTFSDIGVQAKGKPVFQPADGSGPEFDFGEAAYCAPAGVGGRAELTSCEVRGDVVEAVWRYAAEDGALSQSIVYELSLRGKTLRIGASSEQRHLRRWAFGRARGVPDARIIETPYMLYSPNILLTHETFVSYYADWYRSNVSMLPYGSQNKVTGDEAGYSWRDRPDRPHAGYAYWKRTDGRRHPFREVFYITASVCFDDVLPTVSNPPSPMKAVLKKRLYQMVLGSAPGIFGKGRARIEMCDRYGMTNIYFLYHATLWFKRRTFDEPFPGDLSVSMLHEPEGGDRALQELFRDMREKGMSPGYYDGYPARCESGPNFHYDWTSYRGNGSWRPSWARPALKPWAFAELAATLYRKRAQEFGPRVSYQDGITSHIKSKEAAGLFTNTTSMLLGGESITETHVSTITDSIILLRYVELHGAMHRGITVLKMRGSFHDKSIREYTIDGTGLHIKEPFRGVSGILAGTPSFSYQDERRQLGQMFDEGGGS